MITYSKEEQLANRAVSAIDLNNNCTPNFNFSCYKSALFKELEINNKIESAVIEGLSNSEEVAKANRYYKEKEKPMIEIPISVFLSAIKLAELQTKTLDILFKGEGKMTTLKEYDKRAEEMRKSLANMVKELKK